MYERLPKLRPGLASLVAAIAIIALLAIVIAPQIDLDDIVIRSGQLFLGILLALISHDVGRGKRSRGSVDVSLGRLWVCSGNQISFSQVLPLLC